MSFQRLTRLLACGVVPAALAGGGLALTPAPAQAGPAAAATYSCDFGLLGTHDVPASFSVPGLPSSVPAGVTLPAQPVTGTLSLPGGLPALLVGVGSALRADVDQFLLGVGAGQAAVALSGPASTVASAVDGVTLQLSGTLASFIPLLPGALPIALPTSFDLGLVSGLGAGLGPFRCTLENGSATPAVIQVTKQTSRVRARVVGRVTQGQHGRIAVKVRRQAGAAAGKVVASVKGKVVGKARLTHGRATMTLKSLGTGLWKVEVTYVGDEVTDTASKTVRLRVVR